MIDFHTHSLPGIDDGSKNIEQSQAILERQVAAGVKTVFATPHFYPDQNLEDFVQARDRAFNDISDIKNILKIDVKLGAEVLISVDTWKLDNLEELCLQGTRYILLEMPYSHWSDWVYTSVEKIIDNRRLIPIIAHVERYDEVLKNPNCLIPFLERGCLLQLNATSLRKESTRKKLAYKLVKHGFIHLLGSDVHHPDAFYDVSEGYNHLQGYIGKNGIIDMQQIGENIIKNKLVQPKEVKSFKKLLGHWY